VNDQPPDAEGSDLLGYREELVAEIAVEKMLKRTRLEEAAKCPSGSVWIKVLRGSIAVAMIVSGLRPEFQYIFTTLVAVDLLSEKGAQIHSRIDAIVELAELDKKEAQAATDDFSK
jgi:hypothetical protein